MDVKKQYIRITADHQIFAMDLEQMLSETEVDVEAVNALMDQHSAAMTQTAKDNVSQYVKLKSVLSPEQLAKAKQLKSEKSH